MMKIGGTVLSLSRSRQASEGAVYEFRSQKDQELRETLAELRQSGQELNELNDVLKEALAIKPEAGRSLVARILAFVTPQWLYPRLPTALMKMVAEEADVLELLERMQRTNINNTQGALKNLSRISQQKYDELQELKSDIAKAEAEEWTAHDLQEYVTQKASIPLYEEVAKLLDEEFKFLPDDEKEARKNTLLADLKAYTGLGEELMKLLEGVVSSGIQMFHHAVGHYYAYLHFYVPIRAIRESAETMTQTDEAMYASRDALVYTIRKSIEAIGVAVEATSHASRYAIASPEMRQTLASGKVELERELLALKETERKALPQSKGKVIIDAEGDVASERVVEVASGTVIRIPTVR